MNIQEYITLAIRTEASAKEALDQWQNANTQREVRLLHGLAGLVSERGELAYETRTAAALLEERSDVCWYCAIIIDALPLRDETDPTRLTPIVQHYLDGVCPCTDAITYAVELDHYLHIASDIIKAYAFYGRGSFVHPLLPEAESEDALTVLREITYLLLAAFGSAAVFEANIAKLQKRYPGKFTQDAANARTDKQELEPTDV